MSGAVSTAFPNPEQDRVETGLRRILLKMADKLDDAHQGPREAIENHMAMACFFAQAKLKESHGR